VYRINKTETGPRNTRAVESQKNKYLLKARNVKPEREREPLLVKGKNRL
jgi:hypothetical protein